MHTVKLALYKIQICQTSCVSYAYANEPISSHFVVITQTRSLAVQVVRLARLLLALLLSKMKYLALNYHLIGNILFLCGTGASGNYNLNIRWHFLQQMYLCMQEYLYQEHLQKSEPMRMSHEYFYISFIDSAEAYCVT